MLFVVIVVCLSLLTHLQYLVSIKAHVFPEVEKKGFLHLNPS